MAGGTGEPGVSDARGGPRRLTPLPARGLLRAGGRERRVGEREGLAALPARGLLRTGGREKIYLRV
jgi:hypothetical protein